MESIGIQEIDLYHAMIKFDFENCAQTQSHVHVLFVYFEWIILLITNLIWPSMKSSVSLILSQH